MFVLAFARSIYITRIPGTPLGQIKDRPGVFICLPMGGRGCICL